MVLAMYKLILAALLAGAAALGAPRVIAVDINGMVHPITAEILSRAIDQAQREHAAAILIRLNTPGGLLDATREIDQKLIASPVPVITYVTPSGGRAASAGFFILQAGDIAAMAPGTNTGAASPVLFGQQMDPVMRSKVENDSAALLRSLATNRGRNAELAEKTVREAKSYTDKEAMDSKLIDIVSPNQPALLDALDGRVVTRFDGRKQKLATAGAEVVEYQKTLREWIISSIADPNIGFILLALGALGIYVEFSSPGTIFPGVAGGILLLLGLSALSVLPINWVGAALLILAAALFVLEAKFASHGILGTGGTVAMILGAMLLIQAPPEFRIHFATAASVAIPFAIITMFLVSLVIRARRNKVVTGQQGMIDAIGETRTPLDPSGKVFVHGEYWDAVSAQPVPAGARVRVVEIVGLVLKVEPCSITG
jgi:membrane-bound serine protease (ClpP class)